MNDLTKHILDSLPAYALGALDDVETRQVAEHLQSCATCQTELDELSAVVEQLALAAPDAAPKRDLKPLLMQRIGGGPSPAPRPTSGWFQALLTPARLAVGLLILLLAVSNLTLLRQINNAPQIIGPLGMRAILLQNTSEAPEASAFVIMNKNGTDGVLVVDELPELDDQHEYRLWLDQDGESTPSANFSVDVGGYRGMRIEAPQSLLLYSAVHVTVEPLGGTNTPSGPSVLQGSLFNPQP